MNPFHWLRWAWLTFVWYPLHGRCAWCGYPMVEHEDDVLLLPIEERAVIGETHFLYDLRLRGINRYACDGCTAYPEG